MKNIFLYFLIVITFFSCKESEPKNGEEVIKQMHKEYKTDWYKTLTFKQATTYYNREGKVTKEQTWFEAMKLPNSLAIKFDSVTSGNGVLFRKDSMFPMTAGKQFASRKLHHPLLILGFSVYAQNPAKTIDDLKNLNIDLTKIKTTEWQGKKNYVIGDENETHFYIEKERLLFTKIIQISPKNSVSETQFNKYEQLENGWISPEVLFFTDGKMTLKEEYLDIKTPILNDEIFDPNNFLTSKW